MPAALPWAGAGVHMVSDGCTDDVLATSAVATVRKHVANPENLIAGTFQRTLPETCSLLVQGAPALRAYAESCGAEPDANQSVARAVLRIRALLCGESPDASDAATEWACWQPRATSLWNCAQQADWAVTAEACQLLDALSQCYERAVSACGANSGRVLRRIALRVLAPLPAAQCTALERAARRPARASHWNALILLVIGILVNVVIALLVLGCCTWYRRRRLRQCAAEKADSVAGSQPG